MGRGASQPQDGGMPVTRAAAAPGGDVSGPVLQAAAAGDLHAVAAAMRSSGDCDQVTCRRRLAVLETLADSTLDNYRPRWSRRFMPLLRSLNYPAGDTAEEMLGPPSPVWSGGYWGRARQFASDSLRWAVEADRVRLQAGRRQRSGLTASWIAENISVSWCRTYLTQLAFHIEGELPDALERYAGREHAGTLRQLIDAAGGREQLLDRFDRRMLTSLWRAYFRDKKPDLTVSGGVLLLDYLAATFTGEAEGRNGSVLA